MTQMKAQIPFFATALLAMAVSGATPQTDLPVTHGANPVFSPDGTRIAFQRLDGDVFKIGVAVLPERGRLDRIEESSIEWVENGPGNAAYPVWTPDGGLVYMAGNDTETAHEAWRSGSQSGYGLRLWRDGEKRDLTRGRCRDYTPCVSPDGRTVFFVTTRGVESESASFSQAAASRIAVIDLAQSSHSPQKAISHGDADARNNDGGASPPGEPQSLAQEPRILLDSPNGNNSGYVQPAVSPDGSFLVWGQLDSFFDTWRICGMRLDGGTIAGETPTPPVALSPCPVTPSTLAALSPRWHPDGRRICFTGFRKGDPGWGIWVEDIRTGKVKRLATGENPCFSLDGAFLAYDRDGTVYIRPFGPDDEPDENLPDIRDDEAPETTLWTAADIVSETAIDISGDTRFAFGDNTAFFVRATVQLNGSDGVRQIVTGDYAENPRAFQLYVSGDDVWLSTRGFDGKWLGAKAPGMRPPAASSSQTRPEAASPGILSIVAVRTAKRLVLSVNGGDPTTILQGPFLSLDTPQRLVAGAGLKQGEAIHSLEIGTGWPMDLPKEKTREDLFQ